jgi:tRNA A-37 threonylcarbamoyl transferase component Bud32
MGGVARGQSSIAMGTSSYQKVAQGEIKGWVKEEIFHQLPPRFFKDPIPAIKEMNGKVLRESRLRWAALFILQNHRRIFLKRDRTKGWIESLKYLLFPSKARKEWFITCQLQKRNLNIPRPFGWMERVHRGFVQESYYLSEAVGSGVSLIDEAKGLGNHFPLLELAKTVRRMHQAGCIHPDLHAGNFMWDGEALFLTDFHSARIVKSLSLRQKLWNLSLLFHSLRSIWGEKDQIRFMEAYFEEDPVLLEKREALLQSIHSWMDRLQKRQWRSRTKRCLKESTEFSIKREKRSHYYHRRDFPLDTMKRMVEEHLRVLREKPQALAKLSPNVTVSLLEEEGGKISTKHYRPLRLWNHFREHFRNSRGLKAWVAGNGLRARGIPSLKPLGLMEKRNWSGLVESFFLMEAFEAGQELDRYILTRLEGFKEKGSFIKAFARWLSHYHQTNLFHRDMKTCNILVIKNGEEWVFYLLDLEDVRLDRKVRERDLFKSLLQLNTSTPKIITTTDRFRFLREYLKLNPIVKNRKIFLKRLIEESKLRGLVYVSPEGVVIEKL